MGLLSIPLDLMTITIAAITIGIAVDNCIHYIYRYREYISLNSGNHDEALIKCNETVGVAIKNTSYTIIAGFSILIFFGDTEKVFLKFPKLKQPINTFGKI